MRFSLRAESPIHIGTGEHLSWLDYALVGHTVHALDWGAIMDALLLVREDVAEPLAAFTDRGCRSLKDAQNQLTRTPGRERGEILRKVRDATCPIRFVAKELGNEVLARAMEHGDFDRYRCEYRGGRLDRRLEILCQAKDGNGKPTIPGSTLRGRIRTALAHAALAADDGAMSQRILAGNQGGGWSRDLAEATPGRARFLFGADVEDAVFRPGARSARHHRRGEFHSDLMRFISVSEPVDSRAGLVVIRASPFGMARGRDGSDARILPLQPVVMEAIEEGSQFEFELNVDCATLRGAAAAGGGSHPLVRDAFWTLFARLFGVARDEVKEMDDGALEERVLAAVEVSLAGHTAALIEREAHWFDRMGAPPDAPLRAFVARFRTPADGRLPLRIGTGAGLHSVTLLPAMESNALLAEPLARVLARVGLGLKPRERRLRAEREKAAAERARREASGRSRPGPVLRQELLAQKRDPSLLPSTRRMTMQGGTPGRCLGFATFSRGEMIEETVVPASSVLRRKSPKSAPHKSEKTRKNVRRATPKKRPPVPDRPANRNEIDNLLKKFGPRY